MVRWHRVWRVECSAYWLGQTSGIVDSAGIPIGGLFGTAVLCPFISIHTTHFYQTQPTQTQTKIANKYCILRDGLGVARWALGRHTSAFHASAAYRPFAAIYWCLLYCVYGLGFKGLGFPM